MCTASSIRSSGGMSADSANYLLCGLHPAGKDNASTATSSAPLSMLNKTTAQEPSGSDAAGAGPVVPLPLADALAARQVLQPTPTATAVADLLPSYTKVGVGGT